MLKTKLPVRFVAAMAFACMAFPPSVASQTSCTNIPIDTFRSLVVRDQATLTANDFSISRTLHRILESAKQPSEREHQLAFLQTLLDTFKKDEITNQETSLRIRLDVRPPEASLQASDLLDPSKENSLVPISIFNRMDLIPQSVSNCGEHRIVYGMKKISDVAPRFFLIFEANMPNLGTGLSGCEPIVRLWHKLSSEDNPAKRAELLAELFYEGKNAEFKPAIDIKNLGMPLGQVRGNFVSSHPWQLREWFVAPNEQGTNIEFRLTTVKSTPITQLYLEGTAWALEPDKFAPVLDEFRQYFLSNILPNLLESDSSGKATSEVLVNVMSPGPIPSKFLDFQNTSDGASDVPLDNITANLSAKIAQSIPPTIGISVDEVLNRVGTATCAGCHLYSSGVILGREGGVEIRWPNDAGFVHVVEPNGAPEAQLSEALTGHFLPFRLGLFQRALCDLDATKLPSGLISESTQQANRITFEVRLDRALQSDKKLAVQKDFHLLLDDALQISESEKNEPGYFVPYRRSH